MNHASLPFKALNLETPFHDAPPVEQPLPALAQRGSKIAVLALLDGQSMLLCGLKVFVATDPGLLWLEPLRSADATRGQPVQLKPDVVLMDADTASAGDLAALDTLRHAKPPPRLMVLKGSSAEQGTHFRRLASQAECVLDKSASPPALVAAIQNTYRHPALTQGLRPDSIGANASRSLRLLCDLTPRERELLKVMAGGLSNQKIAVQMDITVATVKFHVTSILTKLQARNRTQAVLLALRHDLTGDR